MKKTILMMSIFILIILFSGCTKTVNAITVDTKEQISELLSIVQPDTNCTYPEITIYAMPKKQKCTKEMTLKECFVFQHKIARKVRYQFDKQRKICKSINARYQK